MFMTVDILIRLSLNQGRSARIQKKTIPPKGGIAR